MIDLVWKLIPVKERIWCTSLKQFLVEAKEKCADSFVNKPIMARHFFLFLLFGHCDGPLKTFL